MVVTSAGKVIDSDVLEKAEDLWERARDKAEEKYDDRSTSPVVSFADFVPAEFQRRLTSSSSIPRDLIHPLTNYFCHLEMTETSCSHLSDLNLIGKSMTIVC
jgi:hypothetical protein